MNFEALHDNYLNAPIENQPEPEMVACCEHCGEHLFEGETVVKDSEGNHFCDFECGCYHHEIKELNEEISELEESKGTPLHCIECGQRLYSDYEVYSNEDKELFCDKDCAEAYEGLEYTTLERDDY